MSEAGAISIKRFQMEESGHGRTRHWLVRIEGRQDCIGVVEPWSDEQFAQFAAFSSGRMLGRFPSVEAAAEALVAHDDQETRR